MASHSQVAFFYAAIPETRHAVRNLDGHLARRAIVHVLAEMVVRSAPHETSQCEEHRRRFSETYLEEALALLRGVPCGRQDVTSQPNEHQK